jgi:hypothetical protein
MVQSIRFEINGSTLGCPDPNEATWSFMEPVEASITGRRVQQGNMRVILDWDLMTDGEFHNLMEKWIDSASDSFRVSSAKVPPFRGNDNADWITVQGYSGDKIAMLQPTGRRIILHVSGVRVIFEDIALPSG